MDFRKSNGNGLTLVDRFWRLVEKTNTKAAIELAEALDPGDVRSIAAMKARMKELARMLAGQNVPSRGRSER